jgi:hypothetical protein
MVSGLHCSATICGGDFNYFTELHHKTTLLMFFPALTALQGLPRHCRKYQIFTTFSTALSTLTYNVLAAWRSGGFHCTFCGLLPFVFARHFQRSYCPACAKPHVVCCVSIFFFYVHHFIFQK